MMVETTGKGMEDRRGFAGSPFLASRSLYFGMHLKKSGFWIPLLLLYEAGVDFSANPLAP